MFKFGPWWRAKNKKQVLTKYLHVISYSYLHSIKHVHYVQKSIENGRQTLQNVFHKQASVCLTIEIAKFLLHILYEREISRGVPPLQCVRGHTLPILLFQFTL